MNPNNNFSELFMQEAKKFIIATVKEAFLGLQIDEGSAIDETGQSDEDRRSGDQGTVKHPESDKRLKQNRGAA